MKSAPLLLASPCRMIKYDVILDEYTVVASMPAPRSNFASALLNGQGYIIGGFETTNTAARSIPKASSSSAVWCFALQLHTHGKLSCFCKYRGSERLECSRLSKGAEQQ